MNEMFVHINEIWRKFFNLPMSEEFMNLKLKQIMNADSNGSGQLIEREIDVRVIKEYCCTIFWDIDDSRRQPDQSRTVHSQKNCDDWSKACGAKGRRPLEEGAC